MRVSAEPKRRSAIALDISRKPDEMRENNNTAGKFNAFSASLIGKSREELAEIFARLGVAQKQLKMRSTQLNHWIHNIGVREISDMTNLSKELRAALEASYSLVRPTITDRQISVDGTRKYLLRFAPAVEAETVFIPDVGGSGALCISSQVGCTLTCSFCHTGTQKLVRNLTAAEIIAQIMVVRDDLGEWPQSTHNRQLTNIVFMGMGEPLLNYDNVIQALHMMNDREGLAIGRRRITVSTSGIVPKIAQLGTDAGPMLAISLHAVRDNLRNELVPVNKKWPIDALLEACRNYPGASNAKRITFEYVMLKGVNDSVADAKLLVKKLAGIPAKVNLIPFNPWPGAPYECSSWDVIENFSDIVNRAGIAAPIRTPRGRDIFAACGQLRSESVKQKNGLIPTQ